MSGGASNRQRGDYFERQVRDALTRYGWLVVRPGGSRGPADLVALRDGSTPLLVQCKLSGRIDPAERRALRDAAEYAGARAIVAKRVRRGWVHLGCVAADASVVIPLDELKVPPRRERVTV